MPKSLNPALVRSRNLVVALTDAQHERWTIVATKRGLRIQDWLRLLADEACTTHEQDELRERERRQRLERLTTS